jgi:hypothetical protein
MAEWSKDNVAVIGYLNLNLATFGRSWLNWRSAGPLDGRWRPLVDKVGEWYVESRHLQDCSPRLY